MSSSSSKHSSPSLTAPQTNPRPVLSPYHAASWAESGSSSWNLFHRPIGRLLPSSAGGTTEIPADSAASAAAATSALAALPFFVVVLMAASCRLGDGMGGRRPNPLDEGGPVA